MFVPPGVGKRMLTESCYPRNREFPPKYVAAWRHFHYIVRKNIRTLPIGEKDIRCSECKLFINDILPIVFVRVYGYAIKTICSKPKLRV